MSQFDLGAIAPATTSGTQLASLLTSWRDALHSGHSGAAEPSYKAAGMVWIDTSASPVWTVKRYDGTDWIAESSIDTAGNAVTVPQSVWQPEVDVASASTCDIGATNSARVRITGSSGISSFGTRSNRIRFIRFASGLLLTHNATSLKLPGSVNITTAAGDTALAASDGSGNWQVLFYQRSAGQDIAPQRGHLFGLTLSNSVADAANDIDIAPGEAASDAVSPVRIALASALTKRLDAAWAVGSGNGGLDTGTIANTTYHIWVISRSDTGFSDALFSTSASSPVLPSGYDYKRRLGSIMRVGGAIVPFHQNGDYFWRQSLDVYSLSNTGSSVVNAALGVPTGLRFIAISTQSVENNSGVDLAAIFHSPRENDTAPVLADTYDLSYVNNSAGRARSQSLSKLIETDTNGQIQYRLTTSGSSITVRIFTRGWIDTRGRLS